MLSQEGKCDDLPTAPNFRSATDFATDISVIMLDYAV